MPRRSTLSLEGPLPPDPSLPFCLTSHSQRLTNCLKFDTLSLPFYFQLLNYPMRIVHPERSEGSLGRPSNFQQLTNCLKFDTLSLPFYFQLLPTVKFCNSFVLITIQIARGVGSPPLAKSESMT
jgi:hypothetical protein